MKYDNVYTVDEENSHRFYQVPKELFVNEEYEGLTSDSKLLYSILLDRKELSRKNKWVDEYKQVYLIYTRENIAELMGVSVRTVQRIFKQLNDYGLIIENRQGLNKPNRIYVCRVKSHEIQGYAKLAHQEVQDWHTSDTELNDTEKIKRYIIGESDDGFVLKYYSLKYQSQLNEQHPSITKEQLDAIKYNIDDITHTQGLTDTDWETIINNHFNNLDHKGHAKANYFFSGEGTQGVAVRYAKEL